MVVVVVVVGVVVAAEVFSLFFLPFSAAAV
jgi:hypothetical protein